MDGRRPKTATLVFTLVAFAGGAYLLWRALENGNPLFYFMSAVGFGMGIAAGQRLFMKGPPKG